MSRLASALDLIDRSRESLAAAYAAEATSTRHLAAGLAAQRAAAALGVARERPPRRASDPWALAAAAAPELSEWAGFFALATSRREEVASGAVRVGTREADDLLRDAETFVGLVTARLGIPTPHHDPARLVPARTA